LLQNRTQRLQRKLYSPDSFYDFLVTVLGLAATESQISHETKPVAMEKQIGCTILQEHIMIENTFHKKFDTLL
jgi:hypothetical protein